jgi:ketosteroid isomerase-like protein
VINSASDARTPLPSDDVVAIQRLVHRYSDAVVHRDVHQWASCWADDAEWDLGRGRQVSGRPAIVDLWTKAMGGFNAVVQMVHNGDAWVGDAPDTAAGRWYIDERFQRADGEVGTLLAQYEDRYVRRDGEWLFASRFLEVHYRGGADLSGQFLNTVEALEARRSADA